MTVEKETMLRGGAILAEALQEKGVDRVFTLSGGFCNPALEGFMRCRISVTNCPHEQVAGHLADATTRITRNPVVCLVGPEGFANAVPAMLEAAGERSPVIFVTGSSTMKRQGSGGFKEIDDVAIAAPLVKYSARITDGMRIREFVDRAWNEATSGWQGPVHLSLPVDIMFSSFPVNAGHDERPYGKLTTHMAKAWPEPQALDHVLDRVAAASRPVLIGGHGIWWHRAEDDLVTVGQDLAMPIFNVPYHRKLNDHSCPAYLGLADVHQYGPCRLALDEADLVLIIGGRLDNQMNFGNRPLIPEEATLICVNASHEELALNHRADIRLLADPGAFLRELAKLDRKWDAWLESQMQRRREWAEDWRVHLQDDHAGNPGLHMHPLQLAVDIQSMMDPGDWLVFDGGNTHFWSEIAVNLTTLGGQRFGGILHPGNYSLLGIGVSLALAAKELTQDRNVVLISGDGAFLSGGLSIEAAFQENLPIIVVIDNNGGLDCISQQQERMFADGNHFATDFRDIPFHSLFEGLGGFGRLVETRSELAGAFNEALRSNRPACLNVRCRGVISPIVAAASDRREKASIE